MGDSDHQYRAQDEIKRIVPLELLPGSERRRQSGRQNYVEPIGREKSVRIFGMEINGSNPQDPDSCAGVVKDELNLPDGTEGEKGIPSAESLKFKCRYCCRVFPTCQALGGHQKAHKGERHRARSKFQKELVTTSVYSPFLHNIVDLFSPPRLPKSPHFNSPHGTRAQAYSDTMADSCNNLDPCGVWILNSNGHHAGQSFNSHFSLPHMKAMKSQISSSIHTPLFQGQGQPDQQGKEEKHSRAGRLLFKQQQFKQHSSSSSSIFQGLSAPRKVNGKADLCLDLQLSSCNRINNGKSRAFPIRNEK